MPCALGVDVEDVLPAAAVGVGLVLVGAQAPVGGAGHGIDRDGAQEADFFVLDVDAVDQRLQVRRIVVAVGLGLDAALVGGVLVASMASRISQRSRRSSRSLVRLTWKLRHGDGGRGEDADDGDGDDQLDQREAAIRGFGGGALRGRDESPCVLTFVDALDV